MAFTDIGEAPLIVEEVEIGAIDLVWVIVAFGCMMVLCAGWVILAILHLALGRVSIFGFHPFNFFYQLATDALKGIAGQLVGRVAALGHWLWALGQAVWRPLYIILTVLGHLVSQMFNIHQATQGDIAGLKAKEQADVAQLNATIAAGLNQIRATYDQAIAGLLQQEGQDFGKAEAQIIDLQVRLNNLQAPNLQPQIDQLTAAVAGLQATLNQDVADLTTTLNGDVSTINATINRDVTDLTQADATTRASISPIALGVVSAATPGIIAQALGAVQPQINNILTHEAECLDPLCDTVTPNAKRLGHLGDLFKNLELLGVEAVLVALAAECLTDPAAVVEDVSSVLHAVGDPVMTAARDLIGA